MNDLRHNPLLEELMGERCEQAKTATIHRFEQAGLGKSPFRFTGKVTEKVFCVPGGSPKAGSSCDYCGTGIRYEFWIESTDRRTFKVGCDCVHKTGDRGLIKQIGEAERKLRDLKNARAKEAKKARLSAKIENAKGLFSSVRGTLASAPHPSAYFASQGRTLADYVQWCFDNGAGARAAIYIERAANGQILA